MRSIRFENTAVNNILAINIIMFLASLLFGEGQDSLQFLLGLYPPSSDHFRPYQILTHFFMHGSFYHILFNMYALYIFGAALERVWGVKRFVIFYFVTALGAALVYMAIKYWEMGTATPQEMFYHLNIPVVGASGAVFGLLLGFGMLFPNSELMLLFLPVPIKAKYFVIGYGLLELYSGVQFNPADNVAHFAHLGGMIFGFILIRFWKKDRNQLY
ncbi:MAG: membrane associated rhomboid family serine protease [Luteibaculaceae bacterium]|jgi:membrane associated rhomboid family serine protease